MNRNRRRARALLPALILLSAVLPARAGDPPLAAPGDRVRIEFRENVRKKVLFLFSYTTSERRHAAGELVAVTADSVTLRRDGDDALERRALAGIDRLSVSVGKRRHVLGGLAGGLVFGALLAHPIMGAESDPPEPGPGDGAVTAFLAGSTVVGGIIGYLAVSDRWEKADVAKPTLSATTVGDGRAVGIGVVCRF